MELGGSIAWTRPLKLPFENELADLFSLRFPKPEKFSTDPVTVFVGGENTVADLHRDLLDIDQLGQKTEFDLDGASRKDRVIAQQPHTTFTQINHLQIEMQNRLSLQLETDVLPAVIGCRFFRRFLHPIIKFEG